METTWSNDPSTRRIEVDGHQFEVRPRQDGYAGHHFDWLTGPNPGYGFSTGDVLVFTRDQATPTTPSPTEDMQLTRSIQSFLADIDWTTGYLKDG